jgi:hypothetical protein
MSATKIKTGAGAVLALLLIGAAGWGWWSFDLRWRPHEIKHDAAEITRRLEQAGWVSPGLPGPKLYMISFRTCPDCVRFKTEAFPKLHAAGVDTRVIDVARRDVNGVAKSTPAERATVAELWVNRSWALAERWDAAPVAAWRAQGLPPADGDAARTAVIETGRRLVEDLTPLLHENGLPDRMHYPTLIWRTKDGRMMACACEDRRTYKYLRKDLGVEG